MECLAYSSQLAKIAEHLLHTKGGFADLPSATSDAKVVSIFIFSILILIAFPL
jgi:hypothetical protein